MSGFFKDNISRPTDLLEEQAREAANRARDEADRASTEADRSRSEADRVGNQATVAENEANRAVAARNTADQHRLAAQGHQTAAQTAQSGAESAEQGALAARTGAETAQSASETAQSAAENARNAAVSARDASLEAQTASESARDLAQTHRNAAAVSATTAATHEATANTHSQASLGHRNDALQFQIQAAASEGAAETAQGLAEAARNEAQSARDESVTARDASQAAQTAAETARDLANTYASSANVTTVATNIANVNSVASNIATINAVEGRASDAESARDAAQAAQGASESARDAAQTARDAALVHRNDAETAKNSAQAARDTAEGYRNAAAGSATQAANSAAAAITALDSFDDRYLGSKASDPASDNDGNALITGALYYNSAEGEMRVYDGSEWIAASAAAVDSFNRFRFQASAGQTVFAGSDEANNTLALTAGIEIVTLNGVVLEPGVDYTATDAAISLTNAANAGDELNVLAFRSFEVADTVSKSAGGTFDGDVTVAGAFASRGIDDNATSTALTIDSLGKVQVGLTSMTQATDPTFSSASTGQYDWNYNQGHGDFYVGTGVYGLSIGVAAGGNGAGQVCIWPQYNGNNNELIFGNSNTYSGKFDGSNNFIVGKNSAVLAGDGVVLNNSGRIWATATSTSSIFNRLSSDGEIVDFRKDNSIVGSINVNNNANIAVNTNSGYGLLQIQGSNRYVWAESAFYPEQDNVRDLGAPAQRFHDVRFAGSLLGNDNSAIEIFGEDVLFAGTTTVNTGATDIYQQNQNLLTTGTYIVSITISGGGPWYTETWSGIMQWYSGGTNSGNATNIHLTAMGHAPNNRTLYARVLRKGANRYDQSLQIWQSAGPTSSYVEVRAKRLR